MTNAEKNNPYYAQLAIEKLLSYGINCGLIKDIDKIYCRNLLLDILSIEEPLTTFDISESDDPSSPYIILDELTEYAVVNGIIEDTITAKDLLDTRLMDVITPLPSTVLRNFNRIFSREGIINACSWFFKFSYNTNYIRRERIAKNLKWIYESHKYGQLEITINLSKPEKDSREIAKLKNMPKSGYPACFLCAENMGYAGRYNHPARQTHRILPLTLNGEDWYWQFSPYVYYNQHCIVLKSEHVPMLICRDTFVRLLEFVKIFPNYFLGSNAGLPIVGGSILNHDHYQGGGHVMPMAKAPVYRTLDFKEFPEIEAGLVKWPMSLIRLRHKDIDYLSDAAEYVLNKWEGYSDETCSVFAEINGEEHNAVTPIARVKDGCFELDLVLRNNYTTKEHPDGLFHPHKHLYHIKKENIGLIEVMGVFILPGRLENELSHVADILTDKTLINNKPDCIEKHLPWIRSMMAENSMPLSAKDARSLIQDEVGRICVEVLDCAGVFKDTKKGRERLYEFAKHCSMQ